MNNLTPDLPGPERAPTPDQSPAQPPLPEADWVQLRTGPGAIAASAVAHKVKERVEKWLDERLQTIVSSPSPKDAQRLTRVLDKAVVRDLGPVLASPDSPIGIQDLHSYAKQQQTALEQNHEAEVAKAHTDRWAHIGREISRVWESIGEQRGRGKGQHLREALMREWNDIKDTIDDHLDSLHRQDPNGFNGKHRAELINAVDRLRDAAEQRGERNYLEADQLATNLHRALEGAEINSDEIYNLLEPLNPKQTDLGFKVFAERYGDSFERTLENVYEQGLSKAKTFLRFNAIGEVLSEQFGVGVGIWERVKFVFKRGWRDRNIKFSEVWKNICEKVKGPESARIESLIAGERLKADADTVFLAVWDKPLFLLTHKRDPLTSVTTVLSKHDQERRDELAADCIARYGKKLEASSLEEAFRKHFKPEKADAMVAVLNGDIDLNLAIRLRIGLRKPKTHLVPVLRELSELPDQRLESVVGRFEERYKKQPTNWWISRKLKPAAKLWLKAVMTHDNISVQAARLRAALHGLSEEHCEAILHDSSESDRAKILTTYDQQFNVGYLVDYRRRRGGDAARIMENYLDTGEVMRAHLARDAVARFSADVGGLRKLLADRSISQQAKLEEQYAREFRQMCFLPSRESIEHARSLPEGCNLIDKARAAFSKPRSLRDDIDTKTDGYDCYDLTELLDGEPETIPAMYRRFRQRYEFENNERPIAPERVMERAKRLHAQEGWGRKLRLHLWDRRDWIEEDDKAPIARVTGRLFEACRGAISREQIEADEVKARKLARRAIRLPFALATGLSAKLRALGSKISADSSPCAKIKERDCRAVVDYFEDRLRPLLRSGMAVPSDQLKDFRMLVKIAEQSLRHYRDPKQKFANTCANAAEIAVAFPATKAVFFMGLPYLQVAGLVSAYVFTARYLAEFGVLGRGYGRRRAQVSAYQAVVGGSTLALKRVAQSMRVLRFLGIGQKFGSTALKIYAKRLLKKLDQSVITARLLNTSESGHLFVHAQKDESNFLTTYGRELEMVRSKQVNGHKMTSQQEIDDVFRRLGREVVRSRAN